MKKLFLIFIFLSAFVSCGGGTKETDKCDGVTCSEWQQCNASSGTCEAKSGRCNAHKDCTNEYICDENHNCVEPINVCKDVTCSSHGICVVENNTAKCNCDSGYFAENLNCVEHVCDDNETKTISCGLNGNGTQNQKCQNQQWLNEGNCIDSDICLNDETKQIICGLNERGEQQQKCINGQWENNGNCIDSDVCVDEESKTEINSCGINGTGVQSFICSEGQWEQTECLDNDVCINSQTREISCGFNGNGIILQVCELGQWQNNGSCQDSDVCTNNSTRLSEIACGLNGNGFIIQSCLDGQWNDTENCEDDDICINGSTQNITCGLNNTGVQLQNCSNGEWINNGDCIIYSYKTGTISQIRQAQNSIVIGDTVKTTGTVMSVVYSTTTPTNVKGIYIQDSTNDFSGIYIYVNPNAPISIANGDNIEVIAKVTDYHGWMELDTTADKIVVGTHGNALFTAKNTAVTAFGEANESMFVNLTDSPFVVTEIGNSSNNFNTKLTDANGNVLVMRSTIYRFNEVAGFAVGTVYTTIKGIITQYDTVYSIQPRNANDLIMVGQITCEPICDEWEACTATNICTLKAGRCETSANCMVQGQECNMTTHVCEIPATVCNPVCDEWETCTATNTCTLTTGRCEANTDCSNGATCNTTTHNCIGGANPQFANGDFSTWTSDTTPESWTSGNFVAAFSKVTRSGTDYALNMSGTNTANGYLLNSVLTAVTDTKPVSITFEMNGSGKISINIACDLNNDTSTAGEQKYYTLTNETFVWAGINTATGVPNPNAYTLFNTTGTWKTFTIITGTELNDFWKSGINCRLEIKAGKTDPFNASIDNIIINY